MKRGVDTRDEEDSTSQQQDALKGAKTNARRFVHLDVRHLEALAAASHRLRLSDVEEDCYLVIPDFYRGRDTHGFIAQLQLLAKYISVNQFAGVLVNPNSKLDHDITPYQRLHQNVGIYNQDLEDPALTQSMVFSQDYNTCKMDPMYVEREIIAKSTDPSLIHEGPTYNCGLASLLMTLATYDPALFKQAAREIGLNGRWDEFQVVEDTLRPRDHCDAKKRRTVIEMFINAFNNTSTYIEAATLPVTKLFTDFREMLLQHFRNNEGKQKQIANFFEGRMSGFVSNVPKVIVALLQRFGFTIQNEKIKFSLLKNFPPHIQPLAEQTIYSEHHSPLGETKQALLADLEHIHQLLETGAAVICSLNIDLNFKLIKKDMNPELIAMDKNLRPDHMVFATKLNLRQNGEVNPCVNFAFHTFGEHFEVDVSLDEFAQGFGGYISATKQDPSI